MTFKNWLLREVRYKGYYRQFRQQHPNMPDYVGKEIYQNRVGAGLGAVLNPQTQTPLRQQQLANLAIDPRAAPGQLMQGAGFQNSLWGQEHVLRGQDGMPGVRLNDFDSRTVQFFIDRRFGSRPENEIQNDLQRTQRQRQTPDNKPILVRNTPNGLSLLEGWHRTMSYFYNALPEELKKINDNLQLSNNEVEEALRNFTQKIYIRGFMAIEPNQLQQNSQPTIDYFPGAGGTGAYVPGTGDYQ